MVGGLCALVGVFILTLPIPIVVNSFASYYKNRLWRNEVSMKKRERIREQVRPFGLGERDYKNFRFVNLADCTAKKRASRNVCG